MTVKIATIRGKDAQRIYDALDSGMSLTFNEGKESGHRIIKVYTERKLK
jgi:hypothetical protein